MFTSSPEGRRQLQWFGRVTAFGSQFAAWIIAGIWGGEWLDDVLETTPWLKITGMILGLLGAGWTLVQLGRAARKNLHDSP